MMIDNPKGLKHFREKVLPVISAACGTTDGAINTFLFVDEGDHTVRSRERSGAKQWTEPVAGQLSLRDAIFSITYITATPATIHLSENEVGSKVY